MSADTLVSDLSQFLYLVIFATVVIHLIRRPRQVNVDIAILFGAAAYVDKPFEVTDLLVAVERYRGKLERYRRFAIWTGAFDS